VYVQISAEESMVNYVDQQFGNIPLSCFIPLQDGNSSSFTSIELVYLFESWVSAT